MQAKQMIAIGKVWDQRSYLSNKTNKGKSQQKMADELKEEISLMREIQESEGLQDYTLPLIDHEHTTDSAGMNEIFSSEGDDTSIASLPSISNGTMIKCA